MLEVGLTHQVGKNFSYSIDALVNGLFGDKRSLNIYLSFNYFWDKGYERRLKKARQNMDYNESVDSFHAGEAKVKKKKRKKRRRKKKKRRKRKKKKKVSEESFDD